jgi:hypothetical protein
LNAWLNRLGVGGVLGIGVLLACAGFYFSTIAPAARELATQRLATERMYSRRPYQPAKAEGRAEELRRFQNLFPPVERLTDELEHLYGLARASKLELTHGEYRLEEPVTGLWSYHVVLPLRGTYPQIRGFVAAVLKSMPIASVDGLRFERKRVGERMLDAQMRVTLYFRPRERDLTR